MLLAQQNQSTPNIPKNRSIFPLTTSGHSPYPEKAKFSWDWYSLIWRHTRQRAAGNLEPVDYAHRGFMPGSRGLKNDHNSEIHASCMKSVVSKHSDRNKRVAYQIGDTRTRQFLPTGKKLSGVTAMCKQISNAGSLRPSDLIGNPADPITFQEIHNGKLALRGDSVVAWIHPGKHTGQADNKPLHCEFVDVAFYCQNSRGVYLESEWFDTIDEAVAFIDRTFGQEVAQ